VSMDIEKIIQEADPKSLREFASSLAEQHSPYYLTQSAQTAEITYHDGVSPFPLIPTKCSQCNSYAWPCSVLRLMIDFLK
jgi:hypothetical protein